MKRLVAALAAAMTVAACSGGTTAPDTTASPATSATTTGTSLVDGPTTTTTGVVEGNPLDERLDFLTSLLNGSDLTEDQYVSTFTSEFQENVTYQQFLDVIDQIGPTGSDWAVADFEERDDLSATVVIAPAAGGEAIRARISLEPAVPFRIEGLLLQPAEPPSLDDPPGDLESAADRLAELGTLRVLAADVTDGTCDPVFAVSADEAAPVGSAFKLYVLGSVADQVAASSLAWDDEIAISEDLKSVPTGVLQDEEEGTEFSVREMAEAMIALSDNTATDHLIAEVGRETVEEAFAAYGMEDPSANIPLLTTREFTALKVGPASGLATQWVDADEAQRRSILDQIADIRPSDLPVQEFDEPIRPDEVEWFATPADLCRVLSQLTEREDPVPDILTINPGIPDDDGLFESIAFKGGSEPGLVAMSWLVEESDGTRSVLAGSVVNPDEAFDPLEATLLFGAMRDLLAEQ